MDVAAILVSLLALGFAIYSFVRQFGLQRRVTSIEVARREEEVAARLVADLTAAVKREARSDIGSDWWLVLTNRGPAVAKNVDVDITAKENEPPELLKDQHSFPLTMDAGQDYPLYMTVLIDSGPTFQAHLRWEDGRGPQTKTLSLGL